MTNELLEALTTAIVEGDDTLAAEKTREALASGLGPREVVTGGITPGIQRTGELWKANKYFLPDVIMSAEAFKAAMKLVEPLLRERKGEGLIGRFVLGVVKGDMHDLGKNLVAAMLEAEGFEVFNLGTDVPMETFLAKAREVNADIVGLGAYMSTTMQQMKDIIAAFADAGLRDRIKLMVGGVPLSQEFADEVGADAWGKDAVDAVRKAKALMGLARTVPA